MQTHKKQWNISFKWARCSSQEGLTIKLGDSCIKTFVKTEPDHEKLLYNCSHLQGFQGKRGHYKPHQEVKCLHIQAHTLSLSLSQMQTHRGALSLVAQSHSNESALVSPAAFQITTLNTQHVGCPTHTHTHTHNIRSTDRTAPPSAF